MTRRLALPQFAPRLLVAVTAALAAGCAVLHEGKLDPARFPRAPATVLAGAATEFAIVADAALAQAVYRPEGKGSGTPRITVPIGPIVEAAAIAALADEFGRTVAAYPSAETATAAHLSARALTLVAPRTPKLAMHDEWIVVPTIIFAIPIPIRQDLRLTMDWQALTPDGKVLWTRHYDSGDVELDTALRYKARDFDSNQLFVELAHEVAYQLTRQAAQDLRRWVETERLRERAL